MFLALEVAADVADRSLMFVSLVSGWRSWQTT